MPDLRRALTNDLNLPVLLLADLPAPPSETPHSPPQLSDLRDYGRIDRIADLVLLLDRAGLWDDTVDKSVANLVVAKNRNGPTRRIDLRFIGETTNFADPA